MQWLQYRQCLIKFRITDTQSRRGLIRDTFLSPVDPLHYYSLTQLTESLVRAVQFPLRHCRYPCASSDKTKNLCPESQVTVTKDAVTSYRTKHRM